MERVERLRELLRERKLNAMLVSKPENCYYLSGFSGSDVFLVVTAKEQWLITDFRYFLQAAQEAPDWTLVPVTERYADTIRQSLGSLDATSIGFEPDHLTVNQYYQFGGEDSELSYQLEPASNIIESIRVIKEPAEIDIIREAVRVADAAYLHLLTLVRPGITEKELALEAEWYMRRQGAQGASFDIIIAAGANSALPHAVPGSCALQAGDLVVVDMGARVQHYCSDMTRTFAVAEAPLKAQEIYHTTLEAQLAGLAQTKAGVTGREADRFVRDVIVRAGYGDYFGHGTGHGVGLEIHEAPRLNRMSEEKLPVNAIVTVEPGIYLPDFGGVRIEDLCLITADGLEPLTASPKPKTLPIYG